MNESIRYRTKTTKSEGVLWLEYTNGEKIFWDIDSFRPNLTDVLIEGKTSISDVTLDEENLYSGEVVLFPRIITIDKNQRFVNIR